MTGAVLATALVIFVAGFAQLATLSLIIVGMCANLFFGGIGLAFLLLDQTGSQHLFIWAAGDLTQTGWEQPIWLAPQILIALLLCAFLVRSVTLMRLGQTSAKSRGLPIFPVIAFAAVLASWLTAASISTVGVIGFIGVISPNIGRAIGARSVRAIFLSSVIIGGTALVAADTLPILLDDWSKDLIPTGSATALLGAPAFIVIALKQMGHFSQTSFTVVFGPRRQSISIVAALAFTGVLAAILALLVYRNASGLAFGAGNELIFSFRWPRVLAAACAGAAMAISGAMLQRVLRNPLASPDIIGVTSGATLSVVIAVIFLNLPFDTFVLPAALLGGAIIGCVLFAISYLNFGSPGLMILLGMSLAATLDALMQFVLAKGGDEGYALMSWLAGSTALVDGDTSLQFMCLTLLGCVAALMCFRLLDMISFGNDIAAHRGASRRFSAVPVLLISCFLAALTTAFVGPMSFVGLLAPHAARLIGAQTARWHLIYSAFLGGVVMIISDHLGRVLLYPENLPAGLISSIAGGGFLFYLLLQNRKQ